MTSARRQRKSRPTAIFLFFGVVSLLGSVLLLPAPLGASTTARIVSDWRTGVAIDGVDPVAYFTDSQPLLGRPEFEFRHQGVVWRFRNDGNTLAVASISRDRENLTAELELEGSRQRTASQAT